VFQIFAGVWFGILTVVVWTLVCLLLGIVFPATTDRVLVVVLWLIVVAPLAWALNRQRASG
jgi:hypothetical protein